MRSGVFRGWEGSRPGMCVCACACVCVCTYMYVTGMKVGGKGGREGQTTGETKK